MTFRKIVLFFTVSCSIVCSCNRLEQEPVKVNKEDDSEYEVIRQWFEYLCSKQLNGRYSGSSGIQQAADYISSVIDDSDHLSRVVFERNSITFENLIYEVKGQSDSVIVFGAHYDAYGFANHSPLPGADDNISGVAVLLNAIKKLKAMQEEPKFGCLFCFYDGEEIGRYGSKYFVATNRTPIKLYVNVDTCGSEHDYDLTLSYNSAFPKLLEEYASLSNAIGALPIMEYAPLGYTTDCEPFLNARIPFIAIGPLKIPHYLHSSKDDISHISLLRIDTVSSAIVSLIIRKWN